METCPAGQLVIRDRKALFVNVESKFRATTFMAKRLKQYPKSESRLKSIRLKGNWKNELATIAVPEGLFKGNRVSTVSRMNKRTQMVGMKAHVLTLRSWN